MKIEDFKEFTLLNDTSFFLSGKEYYVFLLNDGYNVGQYDNEDSILFGKYKSNDENFKDMIENWIIEGKSLKELLDRIELNY